MSLISIVAREDFISVVTDETEDSDTAVEYIKFKEVIPATAFVAFSGDEEYAKSAVATAENLVLQGLCLKEIAEEIQASFSSGILSFDQSGRDFTAVVAGYSHLGESQYHIVSNRKELESFYPGEGESLYYANNLESMLLLEKMLKIHGIGTIRQAQAAQLHMLQEAAKIIPNVNNKASILVINKSSFRIDCSFGNEDIFPHIN